MVTRPLSLVTAVIPFGEPFGWDLATTKDFVDYRDCGVAVPRGGDDEQDQFTS